MYGFLFFIPTIALMPHVMYFLPVIYFLYSNRNNLGNYRLNFRGIDRNLILISAIVLLCFINRFCCYIENSNESILEIIPYTILMFFSYFYSKIIRLKDLKVLVYLILVESIVVILEYLLKINTFIPSLDKSEILAMHTDELYYSRPFGLSSNSSVIAYKIFLAFLLLDILKLKTYYYQIIRCVLFVAIFLTFNRTVFLVLLIYLMFQIFKPTLIIIIDFLYLKLKKKYVIQFVIGFMIFMFTTFFVVNYFDSIISQLTRNKGFDLAGRDEIWADFFSYIKNHLWLGNGSKKYLVDYYSGPIHAHNSFIQILANNGLFITLFFLLLIITNINRLNVSYIIAIIIYSLFQYGIFWGISLVDILFFMILFRLDIFVQNQLEIKE
jgi:hypothetical protein